MTRTETTLGNVWVKSLIRENPLMQGISLMQGTVSLKAVKARQCLKAGINRKAAP